MKISKHCWCWQVVIATAIFCWTVTVEGATRCYCNREECKDTYTCISHAEKCYSKLFTVYEHENGTSKASSKDEHGCVDLVEPKGNGGSGLCDGRGDVIKQLKELEPLILCCSDTMCNYRRNQDIQVDIIDPAITSKDKSSQDTDGVQEEAVSGAPQSDEDVIFRAAVIAVPIAGGLILVILILMAVRMLREDYRRSDSHRGLLKTRNFIEQHFVRRDNKKTHSNKKSYLSSNIKMSGEQAPAPVHHHTQSNIPRDYWSEVNECLIRTESVSESAEHGDTRPTIRVSLLNSPKEEQSTLTIV